MNAGVPHLLEWDTQFFGVRIAALSGAALDDAAAERALEWCREHRIACLYLRSDADDVVTLRSAGAHGFRFVDVRMTFDRELGQSVPGAHPSVRLAREEDVAPLRQVAAYNHTNTRFYADGRFPRERCDELYATWIEKSVRGWADAVLVADEGDGAVGYLTVHLRGAAGSAAPARARGIPSEPPIELAPEDESSAGSSATTVAAARTRGEIGLVGLAREAQGRGLGKRLAETALAWLHHRWFDAP